MAVIIGSVALNKNLFGKKFAKDIDLMVTEQEYATIKEFLKEKIIHEKKTKRGYVLFVSGYDPIELEIVGPNNKSGQQFYDYNHQFSNVITETMFGVPIVYAQTEALLALKLSHRYLKNSPHFHKTMADIRYLRSKGVRVPLELKDWLAFRSHETYNYSHPSLNKNKESFFTDNVPYKYDHDTIHWAVKHLEKPAFEYIKKDSAEVYCSREKFENAPETTKLYTVLEETYVLALERCLIPNDFKPDPFTAFRMALEKVCTSITSGWFREYAWENYHNIIGLYESGYVDKFNEALSQGKILPYAQPVSNNT